MSTKADMRIAVEAKSRQHRGGDFIATTAIAAAEQWLGNSMTDAVARRRIDAIQGAHVGPRAVITPDGERMAKGEVDDLPEPLNLDEIEFLPIDPLDTAVDDTAAKEDAHGPRA